MKQRPFSPCCHAALVLAAWQLLSFSIAIGANIWDGGGADGNWTTVNNWDNNALPGGGALTFRSNNQTVTNNDRAAAFSYGGVNFTNTGAAGFTDAFTLGGNSITLNGNIATTANTAGSTITDLISLDLILNNTRTITTNQQSASVQHNLTIGGTISETGGARGLNKAGDGVLTLTGANSFTGTTTVNAGLLDLGGGGATGSLASTVLTLGGGSFSFTRNDSATQAFATTNINASLANVLTVASGNTLDLGTVNRGTGVFLDFSNTGAGTVGADSANNVGGIMPGFTFGNTWAVANGAGVAISGLADGSYTLSSAAGTTGASYDGNNVDIDSTEGVLDAAITANSLRFSAGGANAINLTGTNVVTTGGIMVGSAVGANLSTITGGSLAGAASKDLSVVQNNGAGGLTISSIIANNGGATALNKSGTGLLTLSGNNTFTGGLFINGGTVALVDPGALNSAAGSENAVTFGPDSSGTLTLGGNSVVLRSLATNASLPGAAIVENAHASAVTLTVGNAANQSGAFAGTIRDGTGGGALALAKAGTGTLTLSGNNTYSGGTTISGGSLAISSDSNLGATTGDITFTGNGTISMNAASLIVDAGRTITINGNATATFTSNNAGKEIAGQVTGAGNFAFTSTTSLFLSNATNDFTGSITTSTGGTTSYGFEMASIADTAGVGLINLGITNGSGTFRWNPAASGTTTLSNRQFAMSGTTGGGVISSRASGASDNLVITRDLLITGTGNKTLTLAGGNTGANAFSGNITDGPGSVIRVAKSETGTWILSGENSYSGDTFMNTGSGTLIFQGTQSAPSGGTIILNQLSSSSSAVRLLADGVTNTFATTVAFDNRNASSGMGFLVGNTGAANGGTGGGTTSNATIAVDKFRYIANQGNAGGTNGPGTITINDGYTLEIGAVEFAAVSTINNNWNAQLAPVGGSILVTGTVQQDSGQTTAGKNVILKLDGTSAGNVISGDIKNAADYPGNPNATPLAISKTNSSTWALSGNNTYTGTTTVSGGTLLVDGDNSAAIGAVTVNAGATLGGSGIIGGDVTFNGASFLTPGNSPGQLTMASLALGSATTTTLELGGTTLGSLYDNVTIATDGTLGYAGTLDVVNYVMFDMNASSFTYDLFAFTGATSATGNFSTVTVDSIALANDGFGVWTGSNGPDVSYTFTQSTGDLIISVVPEPGPLALLACGGVVGLFLARRRR